MNHTDTAGIADTDEARQQQDFASLLSNPEKLDGFINEAKRKIRRAGHQWRFQPSVLLRGICVTHITPTTAPFCLHPDD